MKHLASGTFLPTCPEAFVAFVFLHRYFFAADVPPAEDAPPAPVKAVSERRSVTYPVGAYQTPALLACEKGTKR